MRRQSKSNNVSSSLEKRIRANPGETGSRARVFERKHNRFKSLCGGLKTHIARHVAHFEGLTRDSPPNLTARIDATWQRIKTAGSLMLATYVGPILVLWRFGELSLLSGTDFCHPLPICIRKGRCSRDTFSPAPLISFYCQVVTALSSVLPDACSSPVPYSTDGRQCRWSFSLDRD